MLPRLRPAENVALTTRNRLSRPNYQPVQSEIRDPSDATTSEAENVKRGIVTSPQRFASPPLSPTENTPFATNDTPSQPQVQSMPPASVPADGDSEKTSTPAMSHEIVQTGPPGPWTPFFLRRATLAGFVFYLVVLMVTAAVLFGVSQRDAGLVSVDQNLYFLWVYGPTAGNASLLWPSHARRQK